MRVRAPRRLARFRHHAYNAYSTQGWTLRAGIQPVIGRLNDPAVWGPLAALTSPPYEFEVIVRATGSRTFLTAGVPHAIEADRLSPVDNELDAAGTVRTRTREALDPGFRYTVRGVLPAWDSAEIESALNELDGPRTAAEASNL